MKPIKSLTKPKCTTCVYHCLYHTCTTVVQCSLGDDIVVAHVFPLVHPSGRDQSMRVVAPELLGALTSMNPDGWTTLLLDLFDHVVPFLSPRATGASEEFLGVVRQQVNLDLRRRKPPRY